MRYTPSNSRGIDSISRRVQQFNTDMDRLIRKFQNMKDVEYEKTKVDKVYEMTEHALSSNEQLDMMLDRLKMIE